MSRGSIHSLDNDLRLHIKNAYIIPDRKSIFPGASRKDMKSEASGACGGGTEARHPIKLEVHVTLAPKKLGARHWVVTLL